VFPKFITITLAFILLASVFIPVYAMQSTYQTESYYLTTPTPQTGYSQGFLTISSILAVGGILNNDAVVRAYENLQYLISTGYDGIRYVYREGVSYAEVTMRTMRRVWNDTIWWVNNGINYWTREELEIRPPNLHVERVGSFDGLTIIAEPSSSFVSAFVTGPTSVTIGNVTFQMIHTGTGLIYSRNGHSGPDNWLVGTGHPIIDYSWILIQRANGNIYLGHSIH